jgi:hypothetical protein
MLNKMKHIHSPNETFPHGLSDQGQGFTQGEIL